MNEAYNTNDSPDESEALLAAFDKTAGARRGGLPGRRTATQIIRDVFRRLIVAYVFLNIGRAHV